MPITSRMREEGVGCRPRVVRATGGSSWPALLAVVALVALTAAPVAAADEPTPTTIPATTTTITTTTSTTIPATTTSTTATTTTTTPPASTSTTTVPPTTTSTTAPPASTTTTTAAPGNTTTTTVPGAPSTTSTTVPADADVPGDDGVERLLPPDDTDAEGLSPEAIEDLLRIQREYDELATVEAEALAELAAKLRRIEELDAEISLTDDEIAATERRLEDATARVASVEREQRSNVNALRRTARALELAEDRLREQAIESFVGGTTATAEAWRIVLDADNANAAGIVLTYAEVVIDIQRATIDDVTTLQGELETLGRAIESSRERAEDARTEVEELERRLQAQRVGILAERDTTDAARVELEAALARIRDRKAAAGRRLETMAIESDNITSVLTRAQRDQRRADTIPLLRGSVDPWVVGSGFGPRLHPIFATVRRHNGLDVSAPMGEPVRAADDGVVVMAETRAGFGSTIVLDHGDRLATLYAHLSGFEVSVGDTVARGELIGRVGSTGWSTGPHLHLELRVDGTAVDPAGHVVGDEPVACEVLTVSNHAIDRALLATRPDCE